MTRGFELVVSAENNPYMAWQALVFHFTCLKHLARSPIIVVHDDEPKLHPLYARLCDHGGRVQQAPGYREAGGPLYPPRNSPATLRHVEVDENTRFIVLCDPDMVVLRPWPLEDLALEPDEISLDSVSYLIPEDQARPRLESIYAGQGVDLAEVDRRPFPGGVPHLIPISQKEPLSAEWLRLIDVFLRDFESDLSCTIPTLASMWALDLAIRRLKLRPVLTRYTINNFNGRQPLPRCPGSDAALLHYCYGDDAFDKRDFMQESQIRDVWNTRADPGTIHEALCAEIRAAGAHFGLS
jgi:hypothetical protein